ncbi:jiangshi isoform X1 [Rhynchophorus ferrugineus]|uniref:jiangshi isoform X1 n=1 Tax=Rhynchophorus ferrugineus TaxID=354439 RepID=UPI003FCEB1B7
MLGAVGQVVIVGFLVGLAATEIDAEKADTFSCNGRNAGYYADVSTGCQVYHMCDGLGRQFSYKCPSKTLFQQRMLICDHWYMVNCSKAEQDYGANLLIGQQGKAFVEDLEYNRTPRPDLVDPNNSDFSTYRVGGKEIIKPYSVSGEDLSGNTNFNEDKSFTAHNQVTESYSTATPVHYKRQETGTGIQGFNKQIFYRTSYNSKNRNVADTYSKETQDNVYRQDNNFNFNSSPKPFSVDFENSQSNNQNPGSPSVVNFPSNFKATTPVYPKYVDIDQSKFTDFGDPLRELGKNDATVNFPSNFKATTPVYPQHVSFDPSKLSEFDIPAYDIQRDLPSINFPSKFKATTPNYPQRVDLDPSRLSEFDIPAEEDYGLIKINFESKFKATTPVYPKHVDVDLKKFTDFAEEPPQNPTDVIVNFASNFKGTTPVYPKHVDVDLTKFTEFADESPDPPTSVNFASSFKGTTPVYPREVNIDLSKFSEPIELPKEDKDSEFSAPPSSLAIDLLPPLSNKNLQPSIYQKQNKSSSTNFASDFQATTPNYPNSVEPTSPDPNEVGLLPPHDYEQRSSRNDYEVDLFSKTFSKRIDDEDPLVLGNTFNSKQLTEFMLTMKPEQLKTLKNMWHIPDYDFPLENIASPNYDSELSSFQAKTSKKR